MLGFINASHFQYGAVTSLEHESAAEYKYPSTEHQSERRFKFASLDDYHGSHRDHHNYKCDLYYSDHDSFEHERDKHDQYRYDYRYYHSSSTSNPSDSDDKPVSHFYICNSSFRFG
jgi:hypothetical protein